MPDRSPNGTAVRGLPGRVRTALRAPLNRPWLVAFALLEVLAVTVVTLIVFQNWLWDALKTDLLASEYVSAELMKVIAVTPFDVVLFQAKVGLALGVIFTASQLGVHHWVSRGGIRRRHGRPVAYAISAGVLLGAAALFGATVPSVYRHLVPDALSLLAQMNSGPIPVLGSIEPVVVACLGCGVAALFPYGMAIATASGRRSWGQIAIGGPLLALVAAVLGAVWWAGGWLTTAAWTGPVAVGAALGVVAAAVVARVR